MEYVIVEFPESRGVLIDDTPSGRTNETLMVEEGHHEFRLEEPADCQPPSQIELIQHTDSQHPQKIVFTKSVG